MQPASPLPLTTCCERVEVSGLLGELFQVFGLFHLHKPYSKYARTPGAVLLHCPLIRGAELLYLAVGKEDFHSMGES